MDDLQSAVDRRICVENNCYSVDRLGNVFSLFGNRQKLLKGSLDKDGYRVYRMVVDGKKRHVKGHRIVCNAFLGPQPNLQVNHKNSNPQDNRVINLEWVTSLENNRHMVKSGRARYPGPPKKIQPTDYVSIYILHKELRQNRTKIAIMYSCSRQTVSNIINKMEVIFGRIPCLAN